MAQKQLEERMKSNKRKIIDLKEIFLGLKESMDRLAEEIKKSVASRRKEESGTSECTRRKRKGRS